MRLSKFEKKFIYILFIGIIGNYFSFDDEIIIIICLSIFLLIIYNKFSTIIWKSFDVITDDIYNIILDLVRIKIKVMGRHRMIIILLYSYRTVCITITTRLYERLNILLKNRFNSYNNFNKFLIKQELNILINNILNIYNIFNNKIIKPSIPKIFERLFQFKLKKSKIDNYLYQLKFNKKLFFNFSSFKNSRHYFLKNNNLNKLIFNYAK